MGELKQLFEEYVSGCRYTAKLRAETIRGYQSVFKLFLKVMPEVAELEDLTPEMLNEFFKRINTRIRIVGRDTPKVGVKNSTIKTQWTKLNVFFDWLCKKNHIEENPLEEIKPPRVNYDDYKRLEDAEINRIYSSIVIYSTTPLMLRRDTLMVSLLLYLGIRRGEFISLQVKDLDLAKRRITIRGETSKSGKTKILPINPTLLLHLKDYLEERKRFGYRTEYLIVSTREDRGLSREGLKHWVNSIIRKSGVKFHLHQFRHTFACKLTENGTPSLALQKLMGHSSITMTEKYARSLRAENMMAEVSRISI